MKKGPSKPNNVVGCEVLTMVTMKIKILWLVMLYSPEKAKRFGGI